MRLVNIIQVWAGLWKGRKEGKGGREEGDRGSGRQRWEKRETGNCEINIRGNLDGERLGGKEGQEEKGKE